ncbi:hypothetical protein AgCh_006120 [Apium graveolens]
MQQQSDRDPGPSVNEKSELEELRLIEKTVKKLRLSKALTIPEGTTVYDACWRMDVRRIDVVLLTYANALLSGVVTDKHAAGILVAGSIYWLAANNDNHSLHIITYNITNKEDGTIRFAVKLLISVDGHSCFVPSIDNLVGMGFYKPLLLVSGAKRRVSGAKEGLVCRYMRVIELPYNFEVAITFVESLVSPNNWGENRKNRRRSKPTQCLR